MGMDEVEVEVDASPTQSQSQAIAETNPQPKSQPVAPPPSQQQQQTELPPTEPPQPAQAHRGASTSASHGLTLSLPLPPGKNNANNTTTNNNGGGGHGRDDCWSEGATNTLIEAWGARYLELNRGNLKQKHWKDVAEAVSSRQNCTKTPKTDVQCKNRLDTLKKKYKLEKSKIFSTGGTSKWPFFHKLDELIGPSRKQQNQTHPQPQPQPQPQPPQQQQLPSPPKPFSAAGKSVGLKRPFVEESQYNNNSSNGGMNMAAAMAPLPMALPLTSPVMPTILHNQAHAHGHPHPHHHHHPHGHAPHHHHHHHQLQIVAENSASSKSDETPDTADSYPNGGLANGETAKKRRKKMKTKIEEDDLKNPLRELTAAILKFGEAYERVERSKLQQVMDLEKQRLEVFKDMELQRFSFFMQSQLEFTKAKHAKHHAATGSTEHYI
eukprot:TRINITY_DN4922_c0_g1_i2.p2 TRINITY_DN4922_c0_g1~~TRINITY_DN4922_c0_g1_i2.p2  ORF type:complete len:437 (-),score=27.30 TRINITY_DN4922_c0_g1_i2:710-2020(-)